MSFANPWGLLGLLAVPAILIIHLFQRRYPILVVGGLYLWGASEQQQPPGRSLDRLPISRSLLLELLAALLLTLLLSQPRFGSVGTATHVVVVLDGSASMLAAPPGEESFRDQALAKFQQLLDDIEDQQGFGSRVLITVIETGVRPRVMAGPAASKGDALAAMAGWHPHAADHSPLPALDLAAQHALQTASESEIERDTEARIVFLTNRPVEEKTDAGEIALPKTARVISVGQPLENVAIVASRWLTNHQTGAAEVFLRIENFGVENRTVGVSGHVDERVVFKKDISIPPNAGQPFRHAIPTGTNEIVVQVDTPTDRLAIDNAVRLLRPTPRVVHVATLFPKDSPLRSEFERIIKAVPQTSLVELSKADLIIGPIADWNSHRDDEKVWFLGVGSLPVQPGEKLKEFPENTAYLIEKRHPLVSGIVLGGVEWKGAGASQKDLEPLISVGNTILYGQITGTPGVVYLLNIDLPASDLIKSPDWGILISNLIESRRDQHPGIRSPNLRTHEQARFRLAEKFARSDSALFSLQFLKPVLDDPESEGVVEDQPLAKSATIEIPTVKRPGVYEIRDGADRVERFAANFHDDRESNLQQLGEAKSRTDESGTGELDLDSPYSWLTFAALFALIAVVFLNWIVLRRS